MSEIGGLTQVKTLPGISGISSGYSSGDGPGAGPSGAAVDPTRRPKHPAQPAGGNLQKSPQTTFGRIPNVAIYLRVSTNEQAQEGDSIDTQLLRCLAQCDAELGTCAYTHEVFQDPGKSGSLGPFTYGDAPNKKKLRKGLLALIDGVREGRFTHVCALSMDRIYRDWLGWTHFHTIELKKRGIGVLLVTEKIDDSDVGDFAATVFAKAAEMQRKGTCRRSQMTLDKRKAEGYWLGTVPFGFRHEKEDEKTHRRRNIVPDPERLEIVKRIFRMHDEGLTPPKISAALNDEGVPFEKGRLPRGAWYETRVLNILKNPAYAGLVRAKDGTLAKGLHEEHRIIEPADHHRTLERIAFRRSRLKGLPASQPFRLFAGVVACGVCGRRLRSCFHSAAPDYRCFGKDRRSGSAAHVYVSAPILEKTVLSEIGKVATSPEVLEDARKRVARDIEEGLQPIREERQGLAASLTRIRAGRDRLMAALEDGHVDPSDVRPRLDAFKREEEGLLRKACELDAFLNGSQDRARLYERAIRALEDFPRLWEAMADCEKRELIYTCLEKLEARSEGGRVLLRLKIASLPEKEVPLLRGRARWTYDKPEGPEGLTPRQLAFLAHSKDGRKVREIAALMEIREAHAYRLRYEIYDWLDVRTDAEAVAIASDWIEANRAVLPLYGSQSKQPPGRHRQLRTMEHQVLCLAAEGLTAPQIAEKAQAPLAVVEERLGRALAKAGRNDPAEALAEVIRLGLAPGKKTWQWGTRRRLSG